ncbi:glycosyl hydrolase family 28-related protein [Noviherbaspirillum aridicola]|nr:glycosyl hydrolase family 28-related protein [Noviherbaspirillum aridicola]
MLPLTAARAATMPTGYVSVKDYGARGDGATDDSVAVQRAMNANLNVWFPAGTYLVGMLKLRSNHRLAGEGVPTRLKQKAGAFYCVSANPGSEGFADPAKNLTGIRINDMVFEGQSGNVAFDERVHLLNLNGVTDVVVEGCHFIKAVADGIYIGSSNTGSTERHNYRVTVRNCAFDGFTKNNRNAISIIDGTDILIDNCKFLRWGRPDMPGMIDIEPNPGINDSFSRIKRITISNCTMWDNAGAAFFSLALRPQDKLAYPADDIRIINCRCVGNGQVHQIGLMVCQSAHGDTVNPNVNTAPLNLLVSGCSFENVFRPLNIWASKGIRIENTNFVGSRAYGTLGDANNVYRNRDISFKNVLFKYLGNDKTYGLTSLRICGVDELSFDGCRFEDCGPTDGVNGQGLVFAGSCASSYVALVNTTITAPLGRTRKGITVTSSHQLYVASNVQQNTVLSNVVGNDFRPI